MAEKRSYRLFAETMSGQLLRYLIVGGCGYMLAMGCYWAGTAIGIPPYPAVTLVFLLNGVFNFALFRLWVFPRSGRAVCSELRRFAAVAVASLTVNYLAFALLYSGVGLPAVPAQAIAIVVATPVGFLANRWWSFQPAFPKLRPAPHDRR
jgi:putative flippase GtrA